MKRKNKHNLMTNMLWLTAGGVGACVAAPALVRQLNAYELRGKNVLNTSGSRGFGLVLGREFVKAGARVAICARDIAELKEAINELQSRHRSRIRHHRQHADCGNDRICVRACNAAV